MASDLPEKVIEQMIKAGLPLAGPFAFKPKLTKNRKGELIIDKQTPTKGPKNGKRGFDDEQIESGSKIMLMRACQLIGTCRLMTEPITFVLIAMVKKFSDRNGRTYP